MTSSLPSRRTLASATGLAAVAFVAPWLSACSESGEEEVGAVEDLMREHGVLRRAILVFRESAGRLRQGAAVDPDALVQTAHLFRSFGEEYHERKLEETHIFPAVLKAGGSAAAYVPTLIDQHNRGRAIIDYVLKAASGTDAQAMAQSLDQFELMYANHAAREDTIVFPAWKAALGEKGVEEMGEKFEEIEKQQFGGDGFDQAVKQIGEIESLLGFGDLAQFTAPVPPN
jgi:hemerythrin-like domain-containing protein